MTSELRDGEDNKKMLSNHTVKLGQVYRALRDVRTDGLVTYKAPASSGFHCVLPKGTSIVIENNPPQGARGVWALPLNYKELEDRLVPEELRNSPSYETYGVGISFAYLERYFVKEEVKEIKFDDEKIQEHWSLILKYNSPSH